MNIRSIDLQVLIPHATDVSKSQALANNQNSTQQQLFSEQLQQITAEKKQQVQSSLKVENNKIQHDNQADHKSKHQKEMSEENQRKHYQEKQSVKTPDNQDPLLGHNVDIKL